jgi:choice-of-anchor B domain-containing protein
MRSFTVCVVLFLALITAGSLTAQTDFNVTRLSRLDEHGTYNDVWGYVAPDGREYALLGGQGGTIIINATDPVNPYEVGFIPGVFCGWRDLKSYDRYVYVVNDCSGGVDVIDMLDPESPVLVNVFGSSLLGPAHNVQIDVDAETLYVCGTSVGIAIYDLAANPVNPPLITTWNGQGVPGSGYTHDLYVQDGLAHVALINAGRYAILDVSNLPSISAVSSVTTGEDFTHSVWANVDGTVAVTADEAIGTRNLQVWDISNKSSPLLISNLSQGGNTIPHNPFIRDDTAYVSYYKRGFIAFDLSDPANPVKSGEYSTVGPGGASQLFGGAWGCYPFQPSGFIYVSDIQRGLHTLRLNEPCAPGAAGEPGLCTAWPERVNMVTDSSPTVILSGGNLTGATEVRIGSTTLLPGSFSILDDQTITFPFPVVSEQNLVDIRVVNGSGSSTAVYMPIVGVGSPVLDSGPQAVAAGGAISLSLSSDPGDSQFLAVSSTPQPSIIAGKISFAIGAGFSDLLMFAPFAAGPGGTTNLPPVVVPASGIGLTFYLQFAAVDGAFTLPADMSNVAIVSIQL